MATPCDRPSRFARNRPLAFPIPAYMHAAARLPAAAIAFAVGIAVATQTGPLSTAAGAWTALAVAAMAAALGWPGRRWRVAAGLAATAAAGAATAAWHDARRPRPTTGAAAADDRARDAIAGTVDGAVDRFGDRQRFRLTLAPPATGVVEVTVDGGAPVLPGDRVVAAGRLRTPRGYRVPGARDAAAAARRRGVDYALAARADDVRVIGARWTPYRAAARAQRAVAAFIDGRGGDPDGRAVLRAMIAGDRGAIDDGIADRFRAAGIAHLLAVSGLHLAATALLVFAGLRRLWAAVPALAARADPTRVAAAVAAPAAVAYTWMTGARTPTLRALAVVLCVLAAHVVRRRARLADALAVAAIGLLVASPAALFEPSFQLSFAAAATIAAVGPRAGRGAAGLVRVTAWLWIALAPLLVHLFGELPVGGLVANLVAVPAVELVVLPLGLAGVALGGACPWLGGPVVDAAIAAAAGVDAIAEWVARTVPPVRLFPLTPFELVAAGAAVAFALAGGRRARAAAAVAAAACAASYAWPRAPDDVVVTFIDVGQGDAALVELPDGGAWLIDAGGLPFADAPADQALPGERAVMPLLARRHIDRIDVVVLSHPHPDHVAGLAALRGRVDIGEVWTARDADYRDALRGLRVVHPPLGVARQRAGASLEVLAPRYEQPVARADPVCGDNDNSLVVRLSYGGARVLFAGDIEDEGEQLVAARGDVRADVVKVPHHGSRTSSTPAFVDAVGARHAVISCGRANRFGFPAREVVDRWAASGARVWRTDRDGTVAFRLDAAGAHPIEPE
ncbi:MAG: DNA internalization-related competence protein ComEC/Rec2 [Deltaproteobacteria bacterium]|nr:MAG: DNA internalization-related competence protein ComEC/Rec2 [Deltaproteobacteria bacterium]